MIKYNKCEGLDCAWCVTFCCPREYKYLKARVKEAEEEIKELKDYIRWIMKLQ